MALFPQSFLDDLKAQTDIVAIINEVTPLKKAGAGIKGLCPFHQEKTPSFTVNRDKGWFKCFGCGVGGDVVKFVQLYQKVTFPEAVRYLAQRAGMTVPEAEGSAEDRAAAAEREVLLKLHEDAVLFFQEQLESAAGLRARRELESRGLTPETIKTFRYGYAPAAGRETLHALFTSKKVPVPLQLASGLVVERDRMGLGDRFRHRLMIPIARDTGSVVAFGGRALDGGQEPKYLNSKETPIYTKGRTLYGLDVTKGAVRKHNYSVMVEGYFDLAQVWQAGVPVVAICGTALTGAQAKTLKRFASKVVLSFDPDTAGQGAAAKSSELLVTEGFQVNVALLPAGHDPDVFIRKSGGVAYAERLKQSQPYLEFLLDRSAAGLDLNRPDSRKKFLDDMFRIGAGIPDAASRDRFADRLAVKAHVTEQVIRDEIKKALAQRKTAAPAIAVPASVRVLPAEEGLLWALVHRPVEAMAALSQLESGELDGLLTAPIFVLAASLMDVSPDMLPELVRERLSEGERALLDRAAASDRPSGTPGDCVLAFRRDRVRRELADVQDQIDRLQERLEMTDDALLNLWERKKTLLRRREELNEGDQDLVH